MKTVKTIVFEMIELLDNSDASMSHIYNITLKLLTTIPSTSLSDVKYTKLSDVLRSVYQVDMIRLRNDLNAAVDMIYNSNMSPITADRLHELIGDLMIKFDL